MSDKGGRKRRQEGGGGGAAVGKKSKYFQAVRPQSEQCSALCFGRRHHRRTCPFKTDYILQNSKATLPVGSRGVLVSCIGGKEQYAAKDSIRILTEVMTALTNTVADEGSFQFVVDACYSK